MVNPSGTPSPGSRILDAAPAGFSRAQLTFPLRKLKGPVTLSDRNYRAPLSRDELPGKRRDKTHCGRPPLSSKRRTQSLWAGAQVEGTEQDQWPQAPPLRLQLLPWLQGSLPTSWQARLALLLPQGGQAASLGGRGVCSPDKVWPMGPQSRATPPRASHGESRGPRWSQGLQWPSQAEPRQLTERAESAVKVGRASGGQRCALSDGKCAYTGPRPLQTWPDLVSPDSASAGYTTSSASFLLGHSRVTDLLVRAGGATLPNPFTARETDAHRGKGWPWVTQPRNQDEPSCDSNPTPTDLTSISSFFQVPSPSDLPP